MNDSHEEGGVPQPPASGAPTTDEDYVSKNVLFQSIATEAGGFYGLVITVASSFFGGTLLFMDKLATDPVRCPVLLLLGWIALVASIALIGWVRLANLISGRLALEDEHDDARRLDRRKERAAFWGLGMLTAGMILILLFGFVNLVC